MGKAQVVLQLSASSFNTECVLNLQKSFLARLTTDKNSEKFFKVFYDRMREAQAEIKATVSVNTGDGLSAKQEDKDPGKDDTKKKG